MFEEFDYESARQALQPLMAEWEDRVVPGAVELILDHSYSPIYAWMFAYEKRLKHRLEEFLHLSLRPWERVLFGSDGAFSEGLSNAFLHGHGRNSDLAITVRVAASPQGVLFSIRDQGPGVDCGPLLVRLKKGGVYYHRAGNGLRILAESPGLRASYSDGGRTLNLLLPLPSPAEV
jgi:hypothetical protein